MNKWIKNIAITTVILTVFLQGCIGQEEVAERKQLIIAMPLEVDVLDTQQAFWSDVPNSLISQPLVTYDMNMENLVPDLAESWKIEDGGKKITFVLPEGYKYSNGDPLDAQALKESWERYKRISPFGSELEKWGDIAANVLDDTTLELVCSKPPASTWADIVTDYGSPWDAAEAERIGDEEFAKNPVASGPFKLKEWVYGSHMLLERNDNYRTNLPWIDNEGPVYLDEVMIRFIPEDLTRLSELEAGSVDIITQIPTSEVDRIKNHPDIQVFEAPTPGYSFLAFNHERSPFNDVRVRRAIAQAINRDDLVTTLSNTVEPRYSILAPAQIAYDPAIDEYGKEFYPHDIEAAMALLEDAGWTDTDGDGVVDKDGQPFTAELMHPSDDPLHQKIGVVVQAQLQEIGIDVNLVSYESGFIDDAVGAGNYDLALTRWSWGDPDLYYTVDWYVRTGDGLSVDYNDLLEQLSEARYVGDFDERTRVYADIQKILIQEVVWVNLFTRTNYIGIRNWVQNVIVHGPLYGKIYLEDVVIAQDED